MSQLTALIPDVAKAAQPFIDMVNEDKGDYYVFNTESMVDILDSLEEPSSEYQVILLVAQALTVITTLIEKSLPGYKFFIRIGYTAGYLAREDKCPDLKKVVEDHFRDEKKDPQPWRGDYVDVVIGERVFRALNPPPKNPETEKTD